MAQGSAQPVDPDGTLLGDDEWLTQVVFGDDPPRSTPRVSDRDGLSMLRGRLEVADAVSRVRSKGLVYQGDTVRHVLVGALRSAGFIVRLTPGRRNPIHVSVTHEADWGVDEANDFDGCFV